LPFSIGFFGVRVFTTIGTDDSAVLNILFMFGLIEEITST